MEVLRVGLMLGSQITAQHVNDYRLVRDGECRLQQPHGIVVIVQSCESTINNANDSYDVRPSSKWLEERIADDELSLGV
jgi:hypothetical protein